MISIKQKNIFYSLQLLIYKNKKKLSTECNNIECPPRDATVCGFCVNSPSWTLISWNVSGKIQVHVLVGT